MRLLSSFLILFIGFNTNLLAQECPDLLLPINGSTNVAVDTTISWDAVTGVTGYIVSVGTTPGGTDIIDELQVGSSAFLTPELGLPDATTVFVTITLFFFNQDNIVCESQSFITEDIITAPECTEMITPINNQTNVPVATNINWNYVRGATGYIITIGTTPGLGDIINNFDAGNTLTYNPVVDFPYDTELFVEIIPYNDNGMADDCIEFSFTTASLGTIPSCTSIITPQDGEINVGLSPLIEWEPVSDAIGYIVNIGSTPFDNNVLDEGEFFTNSTFVINFETNSVYFVQIIPFNDAGQAIGCQQTSFSTILGCGPFYDAQSGELTTLNPELSFPNEIGLCLNTTSTIVSAPDVADGYRWYQLNANDDFVIISETANLEIFEAGIYKYEAYNYTDGIDVQIECPSDMEFVVTTSEIATVLGASVSFGTIGLDIEIYVEGNGSYEYALNDSLGSYQDANVFVNAPETTSIAYIRDKNGCGVVSINIEDYIPSRGFPKFFTPNNDGFNDYWQYRPKEEDTFQLKVIYIFNRYGKLLKALDPDSKGWSGRLNNYAFSSSDFWYKAETTDGRYFTGHFALKR